MIIAIEKSWGKEPGWYTSLPLHEQARQLALWNVENTPAEEVVDKRSEARQRLLSLRNDGLGGED